VRRQRRFRPRHHGACGAHGRPLRRLHQRLSPLQPQPESESHPPGLYEKAGPRHRHRGALQHPVHRG